MHLIRSVDWPQSNLFVFGACCENLAIRTERCIKNWISVIFEDCQRTRFSSVKNSCPDQKVTNRAFRVFWMNGLPSIPSSSSKYSLVWPNTYTRNSSKFTAVNLANACECWDIPVQLSTNYHLLRCSTNNSTTVANSLYWEDYARRWIGDASPKIGKALPGIFSALISVSKRLHCPWRISITSTCPPSWPTTTHCFDIVQFSMRDEGWMIHKDMHIPT